MEVKTQATAGPMLYLLDFFVALDTDRGLASVCKKRRYSKHMMNFKSLIDRIENFLHLGSCLGL